MKEWIENDLLAIIPTYDGENGNCTYLETDKGRIKVKKTIKTVIRQLCGHYQLDLSQSNNYYRKLLPIKVNIPIPITPELVYIQLKVREPIGKDDGAMGYIKLKAIEKIIKKEGDVLIRLNNKVELKALCTFETIDKQIHYGEIVRELVGKKEYSLVKESLEYYNQQDGPAMKSDIARLYMKLDDFLKKNNN